MKAHYTDFDDEIGSMEDDSVVLYQYPSNSNGFSFISHMVAVHGGKDKSIVVVTDKENTLDKEFEIYKSGAKISDSFDVKYPADNIRIIDSTENSLRSLIDNLEDSIIFYHNVDLVNMKPHQLDQLRDELEENNISVWLCDPYDQSSKKTEEIVDIILEFDEILDNSDSFEYIYVRKHRHNKSQSHTTIPVEFNPYLSIGTADWS